MSGSGKHTWQAWRRMAFHQDPGPVSALFGNLAAGATIEEFLDWFQGVEKWQANAVLEHVVADLDANEKQ